MFSDAGSDSKSNNCDQATEDLPFVSDMGFDQSELALLETIRNICCSMTQPGHDPLKPASHCLTKVWSITHSSVIFDGLFNLITVLRDARNEPFHFVDPRCAHCSRHIGPSEVQLIYLLRHVQSGNSDRATDFSRLLAAGGDAEAIEDAAMAVAQVVSSNAIRNSVKVSVSTVIH
ncbi:MAG: hypothetical protein AAGB04_00555 [Pseudomonadota bacterium]